MRFRGAASMVAVCEFCRSTLVREGAKLEDIGKQAELIEDASPLQLGVQGRHKGAHFAIVGRIQYRYGEGAWNEWHLLFDGGGSGWLSDADGRYLISTLRPPAPVPAFEALRPGEPIVLHGEHYEVANVERAEVVSGEGELPFKFLGGWAAPVADLRGPRNRFATIDYSDTPPRIYAGEQLPFDTFGFAGLRDLQAEAPRARARAFRCPGCAGPVEKRLATTQTIGCAGCGAAIDVTKGDAAILSRHAKHTAYVPLIPLGSRAKFGGAEYEVVGYLRRSMTADGTEYYWGEYLLHNLERGYLWITEYNGHFNVARPCAETPQRARAAGIPEVKYLGRRFRHFQSCQARVQYLLGEFNWRVKLGDTCELNEYVAPPLMLSAERTGKELTWTLAEYTDAASLWRAFRLKTRPPQQAGVFANQPSPYEGKTLRYFKAWLGVAAIAGLVHLAIMAFTDSRQLHRFDFVAEPRKTFSLTSPVIQLDGGRPARLALEAEAPLYANSEVDLQFVLVNADTGESYLAWNGLWHYTGYDSDGAWRERENRRVSHIPAVPPGRYTLSVRGSDYLAGRGANQTVAGNIKVYRGSPDAWNLGLLLGVLLVPPLGVWWRSRRFESARWAESDYPPQSSDDEDE